MVEGCGSLCMLCVFEDDSFCIIYKLSVDVIFVSVVKVYGVDVLVVVLMGMGVDGWDGVCMFK